jgi:peptide/nickel transport system permease protein
LKFLTRRLLSLVLTLFASSVAVFLVIRVIPGDPAQLAAGPEASRELVERLRAEMGLDKSLPTQYIYFMSRTLKGDLGSSLFRYTPVADEVGTAFIGTAKLAALGMAIAIIGGILAGVISAVYKNSFLDWVVTGFAIMGAAVPVFLVGLILMLIFALKLNWLPVAGAGGPEYLVLPALTLAAYPLALCSRMTRSSLLEVLSEDYIRTARAKGLANSVVIMRHGLKNALIPIITVIGVQAGYILGGATIVTETIFSWPGMGRLLVESILSRDYPTIQGTLLAITVVFSLVNALTDLVYMLVNPRVRIS